MIKEKKKKSRVNTSFGIIFLIAVIFLYIILFIFQPEKTILSLKITGKLLIRIAPLLLLVIVFMAIVNYFINPKKVLKYVGTGSGFKGWLIAMFMGIISHGPIYIWYPLLKDLKDKGMKNGLIAVFLYNRTIKIPLLPVMIYYFGATFVVVLLFYMLIASLIEGKLMGEN